MRRQELDHYMSSKRCQVPVNGLVSSPPSAFRHAIPALQRHRRENMVNSPPPPSAKPSQDCDLRRKRLRQ